MFLEAAAWEDGALALTNEMLMRLPTVRITWLVKGTQVRRRQRCCARPFPLEQLCDLLAPIPVWGYRSAPMYATCEPHMRLDSPGPLSSPLRYSPRCAVQALDDRVELPVYLNVTRKQIINGISYSGLITTGLVKSPEGTPPGTWYQRGTSLQLWRQV